MSQSLPDKPLFIAFLVLLLWLPLPVGSNRPWAMVLMLCAVIALALWWLWLWQAGRVELTPALRCARWMFALLLLWLVWLALQLVPLPPARLAALSPHAAHFWAWVAPGQARPVSLAPYDGVLFWLRSLAYVLVFGLTLALVDRRERVRTLMLVMVLGGAFQAFYGSVMVMSGLEWGFFFDKDTGRGVATGTFINRNHLAGYLELCLSLGIGLLLAGLAETPPRNWRQRLRDWSQTLLGPKLRLRILLAVMVVGLVMTHSRMGNSAFFTSLMIAGVLWLLAARRRPRRGAVLLLVSLLVVDIFIVGQWFGVQRVMQRLQQTRVETEARVKVDQDTLAPLRDYWLTGSGANSYYTIYPAYKQGTVQGFYNHAHNDYLEFSVEAGLAGAALPGLVALVSWWMGLRALFTRRRRTMKGLGFAVTMAGIAFAMHSSVDFNLQIPSNAVLFMVILVLGWVAATRIRAEATKE